MSYIRFFFLLVLSLCIKDAAAKDYNILDFGASSDTSQLSTDAINSAINQCCLNGGGRVVIPSGCYRSGTIVLKDNVELFLERGAVLFASVDTADFPRQRQPAYRSQKDPGGWFALIYAEGAHNIGISGKGTIDGQGARQISRLDLQGGDRDGRPRNILFISCKKIAVEGITMLNAGIWNQHYLNCEDVLVNNIHVFNHSNRNNDGIDIDGCRRFVLSNSIIDSDDDGIVMKSTGAAACEDIIINNCIVSSFTNAIKCGTESTGGFKNIAITNCTVKPSVSGLKSVFGFSDSGITGISLEIVDGGIMDGVVVSNIVIRGTQCPLYIRLGNRARKHTTSAPEPGTGQMKNVCLSDIIAYETGNYSSSITGVPGSRIENIALRNIRIVNNGGLKPGEFIDALDKVVEDIRGYPEPTIWKNLPSYGFFIRHVQNASLTDISLSSDKPESRYAIIGVDVKQLEVNGLKTDAEIPKEKRFKLMDVNKFNERR